MPYAAIPARLAVVVAEYTHDTARWGSCPSAGGEEHRAERSGPHRRVGELKQVTRVRKGWRGKCAACGEAIPWRDPDVVVLGGSGNNRVFDTPSGHLEPGCLFWVDHYGELCHERWEGCAGPHLHAILPNGRGWDIDSRANNCGSPDDRRHRCWIRHGEPPAVTVDKAGRTCSAGAGSIAAGDYHGFLQGGVFTAG